MILVLIGSSMRMYEYKLETLDCAASSFTVQTQAKMGPEDSRIRISGLNDVDSQTKGI